jgi:(3,5-dihydroxyphenyl)acetyl-CoA 1,2-dioxygenase
MAARTPGLTLVAHDELEERLRRDVASIYEELTDGLRRQLRVAELVYAAAEAYPGLLPTRADIDAERELPQKDKRGLEIAQGIFVAHVLADARAGLHLMHSMSQPKAEAQALLEVLQQAGSVDLGPMRVDRIDNVGQVTIQNHAFLNSEDDVSTAAFETAVDLVLLDDAIEIGVLRGAPATHQKYKGRRIFGSGINLTHLYYGKISLLEFMLERELGGVSKMYRGHDLGRFDDAELETRREKPWIAAVEAFAIGGACQWLLVMDRVIAESGSYFNLPARKEGIIPGCADLRLPRFVGERVTRQAIFFNREFSADGPEGQLLADEVVSGAEGQMEAAVARSAAALTSAGTTSLLASRRALRIAQEPLDRFRRYMANYARDQAHCLYSPALIDNLERNWDAKRRRL